MLGSSCFPHLAWCLPISIYPRPIDTQFKDVDVLVHHLLKHVERDERSMRLLTLHLGTLLKILRFIRATHLVKIDVLAFLVWLLWYYWLSNNGNNTARLHPTGVFCQPTGQHPVNAYIHLAVKAPSNVLLGANTSYLKWRSSEIIGTDRYQRPSTPTAISDVFASSLPKSF